MLLRAKVAVLGFAFAAVSTAASAQAIIQNDRINIAAVVSVGGPPASVTQNGAYNYAGVVQSGVNLSGTVAQTGTRVNSGFVAQSGKTMNSSISQGGGARVYNAAAVAQTSASFGGLWRRR